MTGAESTPADVLFSRIGAVGLVTLNRPEKLNALRASSFVRLQEAIDEAAAASDIRALVLTGAGRGFCSGEDLTELGDTLLTGPDRARLLQIVEPVQRITRSLMNLPIPVIAAVNGPAAGLGAELALNCDMRIVSRTAVFSFPEVTRGLMITNGGLYLLPRIVGHGRSMELLTTGNPIGAERAESIGLANEMVADDDALPRALVIAKQLAANSPMAVRLTKGILNTTWDKSLAEVMDLEVEATIQCFSAADAVEGVAAYVQCRPAEFDGSR